MMRSIFNAYKDKHMKDVNIRSRFPLQTRCNYTGKIQCHVSRRMNTSLALSDGKPQPVKTTLIIK